MKKSLQNLPREPFLSVVIPAYNEAENFKRGILNEIWKYLKDGVFSWEVVLVNDGSTDETPKLLADFITKHTGFNLIDIPHGGKLKAIESGIKNTYGEIVLISDFDQSTKISEFEKFLPYFKKGADIVIGSRVKKGAKRINDRPLRFFRSRILNLIIKIFLFSDISDTQCGFKAFRKDVGRKLFSNLKVTRTAKPRSGFMGPWDIEFLYLAKKLNYKIVSVPVVWYYFPSKRLSQIAEPVKFLIDIFKIKLFDISGRYIRGAPLRGR